MYSNTGRNLHAGIVGEWFGFQPGFPARDGEEHRRLCYRYKALSTEDEKTEFFSQYGVQWTEFARLEYFDLVKYTIIDPMHNLLLGKHCFGFSNIKA
jgi:hypothetical protein